MDNREFFSAKGAPIRRVRGGDPYTVIKKALTDRLAAVEGQKKTAATTDISAYILRSGR
jgi:hypothetical protein